MTELEIPFAPMATIYRSPKFVCIEPLCGSSALHYREENSVRTYLEHEASNNILGGALLAALDRSRFFHPFVDREFYDGERAEQAYDKWEEEFMSRYGYKSKREAYKNLDWCFAKRDGGRISIQPHRRLGTGRWKGFPPDQTVVIPDTRDAATVGAALRMALNRCE